MPAGQRLTVFNHDTGTSYTLTVGHDGTISKHAAWRCRDSLRTPPGYPCAGPLGEVGEQRPPETPGWGYTFESLEGGGVKATPHPVEPAERERIAQQLDALAEKARATSPTGSTGKRRAL